MNLRNTQIPRTEMPTDAAEAHADGPMHLEIDRSVAAAPIGAMKIAAKDVDFFYGEKQALFDVSLDIADNAVTALIGRPAAASPPSCAASTG